MRERSRISDHDTKRNLGRNQDSDFGSDEKSRISGTWQKVDFGCRPRRRFATASGDTPGFESARRTRREETMRRESRKQRVKLNPNPFGLPRPGYLLHARLEPRTDRVKGTTRVSFSNLGVRGSSRRGGCFEASDFGVKSREKNWGHDKSRVSS